MYFDLKAGLSDRLFGLLAKLTVANGKSERVQNMRRTDALPNPSLRSGAMQIWGPPNLLRNGVWKHTNIL